MTRSRWRGALAALAAAVSAQAQTPSTQPLAGATTAPLSGPTTAPLVRPTTAPLTGGATSPNSAPGAPFNAPLAPFPYQSPGAPIGQPPAPRGASLDKERRRIAAEFAARRLALVQSEEWRALSRSERKAKLKALKERFRRLEDDLSAAVRR